MATNWKLTCKIDKIFHVSLTFQDALAFALLLRLVLWVAVIVVFQQCRWKLRQPESTGLNCPAADAMVAVAQDLEHLNPAKDEEEAVGPFLVRVVVPLTLLVLLVEDQHPELLTVVVVVEVGSALVVVAQQFPFSMVIKIDFSVFFQIGYGF
jgi:hypothetical protein